MFSLACNLTKNDVEFLPIEISSKKLRANNVDLLTIKITSKKVRGNNVDFLTIEITSKKVRGKNVNISNSEITPKKVRKNNADFSNIKITSKKVGGNNVNFSIREITSKKYEEMTWKFVKTWSSTYRRNIDVESTSIRHSVPVWLYFTLVFEDQTKFTSTLKLIKVHHDLHLALIYNCMPQLPQWFA